jgi:monofunctional biosynthetic peptidoglycan transglycosylase
MKRFIGFLLKLSFSLVVLSFVITLLFTWITPPRTSYMLQDGEPVAYQFVSLDHVSRYMVAATIAHEDQQLGTRQGAFDVADFQARAKAYLEGKPDPSGSTIPQQLVKNIFLWPDQSALRKGLEAGLASEFSLILSKQRILELYLNYAQFGPRLYGVCAASWYYFNTPPWAMTEQMAGQLMGVLPLPNMVGRDPNGGVYLGKGAHPLVWDYVNGSANVWVPRQIDGLGGWKATVATVGITDTAADHEARRDGKDSCSTMPQVVRTRLVYEGYMK